MPAGGRHGTPSAGTEPNTVEVERQLFGFLTRDANAEIGAVHPKAMPVILRTEDGIESRTTAPAEEALRLQRSVPDGSPRIVAPGREAG